MIDRKEIGLLSFRLQSNLVVSRNLSCSGLNFFSLPFCSTQNLHEFVVSDDILCLTDGHTCHCTASLCYPAGGHRWAQNHQSWLAPLNRGVRNMNFWVYRRMRSQWKNISKIILNNLFISETLLLRKMWRPLEMSKHGVSVMKKHLQ